MGLDRFDGNTWTTDDLDLDKGIVVLPGQQLPQLPIQPNPAVTDVRTLTQEVHIISSPGRWLPMAYAPQSITVSSGSIRYDPSIVAAQPASGVHPGLTYSVTSLVAKPTFAELHRSFDFAPFRQYLQLPTQTKADVLPIVSGVLQRAGNPSDPIGQILAIQTWFTDTGGFTYSTSVSGEHDTQALLTFLSRTRRGFCQQFAGAMAVMLRAIGIPARVAVGFAQGRLDHQTHTWTVTTADAHSWVEVPLPGFGWVPFEPTPRRTNVITQGIVASSDRSSEGGGTPTGGPSNGTGTQRDNNRPGDFVGRGANPRSLSRDPSRGSGQILTTRSYGPLVILALAILLVLGAIGIPLWKVAWRRRQLRRARSPRELSLAAYRVFASRAADVGFGRWPGETLPEYRARLRRELRSPNGDLDRLTQIVAAAAYRPQPPTREEAREAVRSGRSAIAAVNRDVPRLRRLAGVLRPRIED
jgi:transglutaminase-like putative cysteine protease